MSHFPEPVQTLYETALQHEQAKNWGAAAACYEKAVVLVTDSAELWARYGLLLNKEGVRNMDGHIDLSAGTRAANCPATTAEELYWRGIGATLSDGDGDSRRDLAASLALDPTRADTWYQYAEVLVFPAAYYAYSDYDASPEGQAHRLHAYDQALALDPDNPRYLAGRGNFYLIHDRLDEALADLDSALALDPALPLVKGSRAVIRFLRHDFRGALQDFTPVGSLSVWWGKVDVSFYIKYPAAHLPPPAARWATALAAFRQAGLREPTTVKYLSARARHHLHYGRLELALADAQAVVARQPRYAPYRELLVRCLLAQEELDMAALLPQYEWLAARPLPRELKRRKPPVERVWDQAQRRWNQARWRHHAAWAAYWLGRLEAAQAHFAEACGFFLTEKPYQVRWIANSRYGQAEPPSRLVDAIVEGDEFRLGQVQDLLPPLPDPEYLRWQFTQQLQQDPASLGAQRAAAQWLNQAAWVLAGPALGEACEACLGLLPPAGYHFIRPRQAAQYEAARELCRAGLAQLPAYAAEFRLLRRALLRAELRDAQNRPGATPAAIQAALDTYDAGLAALGTEGQRDYQEFCSPDPARSAS